MGGKYTNDQIRNALYESYVARKLPQEKVFSTTINLYAEVSRQVAKVDGKGVVFVKIKSWK